ncbi:hypothetical protein [Mycobacterium tilburgii]
MVEVEAVGAPAFGDRLHTFAQLVLFSRLGVGALSVATWLSGAR